MKSHYDMRRIETCSALLLLLLFGSEIYKQHSNENYLWDIEPLYNCGHPLSEIMMSINIFKVANGNLGLFSDSAFNSSVNSLHSPQFLNLQLSKIKFLFELPFFRGLVWRTGERERVGQYVVELQTPSGFYLLR